MTFHALKHGDIAQIQWVLEWFVSLMTGFALPVRQ
jgi:hypothetical protein